MKRVSKVLALFFFVLFCVFVIVERVGYFFNEIIPLRRECKERFRAMVQVQDRERQWMERALRFIIKEIPYKDSLFIGLRRTLDSLAHFSSDGWGREQMVHYIGLQQRLYRQWRDLESVIRSYPEVYRSAMYQWLNNEHRRRIVPRVRSVVRSYNACVEHYNRVLGFLKRFLGYHLCFCEGV